MLVILAVEPNANKGCHCQAEGLGVDKGDIARNHASILKLAQPPKAR